MPSPAAADGSAAADGGTPGRDDAAGAASAGHGGSATALGIDVGGTKIEARLLQLDGRERWRHRVATPPDDYAATVQAVAGLVRAARAAPGGQAFTLGVGTPGSAGPDGLMKNCNSTWLNGRPLQRDLERAVGQPLRLANDADCLALSEATDGAGVGAGVVFAAILGTGTGAGIAVGGALRQGPNGLRGEWGHNPLPFAVAGEDPQPPCWCGKRGCLETLLSGPAIANDHFQATGQRLTGEQVAARASAGDADCERTVDRHAHRLARALAGVVNLLDPDVVVLGGGLSLLPHLYRRVPALWGRWVFGAGPDGSVRTRLLPSRHGDASGARGAAWLWWRE